MDGDLGRIGSCDAILCRPGTFSASGRQDSIDDPCLSCDGLFKSPYLGHTVCKEIESERGVLELLFVRCGGFSWNRLDQWYGDGPICSWEGIDCAGDKDDDEGVISISLGDNAMNGTLPSQIWSLPYLTELSLTGNSDLFVSLGGISSPVPSLEKLSLSNAKLAGLQGISKFPGLKELEVSGLTGTLPAELFELKSLEELYLSDNFFVGSFPAKIAELSGLRHLHAASNDFHGSISSELGRLSLLETLGEYSPLICRLPLTTSYSAHRPSLCRSLQCLLKTFSAGHCPVRCRL
jgi:hypothetical protein